MRVVFVNFFPRRVFPLVWNDDDHNPFQHVHHKKVGKNTIFVNGRFYRKNVEGFFDLL